MTTPPRPLDLALQGGGSHGAFTWGVLDRLLEDESIELSAISGTSAGALNAAVLASGMGSGGRDGGRRALREFWLDISRSSAIFAPFAAAMSHGAGSAFKFGQLPGYQWMDSFLRSLSPYDFNPMNLNPLRDVIERHVDPIAINKCDTTLFITATNVHTGQARVFTGSEISIDALLASACLPFVFQAVMIDGEAYWDGGYTGNPAIFPLIYDSRSLDVMLVRINPLFREGIPRSSIDILDRLSEITFNASLIGEMRAISFVSRLVRDQKLDPGQYKALRIHMIADDAGLAPLGASSKFDTAPDFLKGLFEHGRDATTKWLKQHGKDIGVEGTVNVDATFLDKTKSKGS